MIGEHWNEYEKLISQIDQKWKHQENILDKQESQIDSLSLEEKAANVN
jgi:hypothetical protein